MTSLGTGKHRIVLRVGLECLRAGSSPGHRKCVLGRAGGPHFLFDDLEHKGSTLSPLSQLGPRFPPLASAFGVSIASDNRHMSLSGRRLIHLPAPPVPPHFAMQFLARFHQAYTPT